MCDIVEKEDYEIESAYMPVENLSPRDPHFAVKFFDNCLRTKLQQADSFAEDVYKTVLKEISPIAQVVQNFKKGSRFVVDMSDATKHAIDNGQLKLVKEGGKLRAQLLDKNGHYGAKLDIKEEFFNNSIHPVDMANSLQLKAMQEQLEEIAIQIDVINSSVVDVLQGQQNDRIALFYSGINLYFEAQSVNNCDMKNALMAQAIRALSDGTQQLSLTMESDIEFLTTKQYDKFRGKKSETIQNRIDNINKAFCFIHQASLARAAIYCEQNEFLAMANVLDEYSRLIDTQIVKNANLLSQCDPTDNGTAKGLWQSRAGLKLETGELKMALASGKQEYYLSIEDVKDEG